MNSSALSLDYGVASKAFIAGNSGDSHLVRPIERGWLIAVVDGLGHGPEAGHAAATAISTLSSSPAASLVALVQWCHESLKGTRGVALTLAAISAEDRTLSWIAVGNVEAVLISEAPHGSGNRRYILNRGGVVGYRLPPLRQDVVPIAPGDLLCMTTDGIRTDYLSDLDMRSLPTQDMADRIASEYAKAADDALVLIARIGGGAP